MSARNGIWLCQTCATRVDNDPERYTVSILKTWKAAAEDEAHSKLGHGAPAPMQLEVEDKWVSVNYPGRLGVTEQLRRDGYRVVWQQAMRENELIDIDGWEYVLVEEAGQKYRLKVKDDPGIGGYLVLLRRKGLEAT